MKNFVDLCKIVVKAGLGGDGLISFRQDWGRPKGGPDGGDGGDGGNVYLEADANLNTLYDFTHQRVFKAGSGGRGGSNTRKGASGKDLTLKVPVGTVVKGIVDLSYHGQKVLVARGGRGGRGNAHMPRDSVLIRGFLQRPERFYRFSGKRKGDAKYYWAEKGEPGEERELVLELKLIADVGIIGLPNVGKTTLLNQLTGSKAEVGQYPFTTLSPNLGVLRLGRRVHDVQYAKNEEITPPRGVSSLSVRRSTLVLADIPGLVEGASRGKGLGEEFLRHVERTKILLHIIDPLVHVGVKKPDSKGFDLVNNARRSYEIVRKELGVWSPLLLLKPEIIAINKADITEVYRAFNEIKRSFRQRVGQEVPIILISGVTGEGQKNLTKELVRLVNQIDEKSCTRLDGNVNLQGQGSRTIYKDILKTNTNNQSKGIKVYTINDLKGLGSGRVLVKRGD